MNEQFLKDTFFPIIRSGLNIATESVPVSIDYNLLMEIADKQKVLPIVQMGLFAMHLEGEEVRAVSNKCLKDIYLFANRDYAIETIKSCFEKHKIEYVLLKGSVLRNLYPEQWMRTCCDVDVLIKEEKLEKAVSALQTETDFQFVKRLYHDVSMSTSKVHLELHFNIKENMDNIDKLLSNAWDYAVPQQGTNQFVFTPEYQIFHVIAHMSYHFIRGGLGIRPYLDLWLLRHKTRFDDTVVKEMCEQCGILKFYEECCNLSDVWLSNREHTPITKALEKYSFDGGVFGSRKNASIAELRNNKGIKYYFKRIFLKKKSLEFIFPKLKKYPILLPYYQVKRWIIAITSKRARVRDEIRMIRKIEDNEVNSIQELFNHIGL